MTPRERPSPGGFSLFRGWLLLCLLTAAGCQSPSPAATRVFCAASLSAALEETARAESIPIALNSGGSNALVRQASLGAGADLLLLADDVLAREQLQPKGYTLTALASNELVVVAPLSLRGRTEPALRFPEALDQAATLAVADAASAPLGSYTEQSLQGLTLKATRVPMQDAQAVLSAVALGHADMGIVYRSDALAEDKVRVLCPVPGERHRPVLYVAAMAAGAPPEATRLIVSLREGRGREILSRHGFLPFPAQ